MVPFLRADGNRGGLLDAGLFLRLLRAFLTAQESSMHGISGNLSTYLPRLDAECMKRFSNFERMGQSICYIDFFATVIAWQEGLSEPAALTAVNLLAAVKDTVLGVEHGIAGHLLEFLGVAKGSVAENPFWVFSQGSSYKLSTQGDWSVDASVSTMARVPDSSLGVGLGVDGSRIGGFDPSVVRFSNSLSVRVQETGRPPPVVPAIWPTARSLSTVQGETCSRDAFAGRSQALISQVDLGSSFGAADSIPNPKQSFSRSLEVLAVDESVGPPLLSPMRESLNKPSVASMARSSSSSRVSIDQYPGARAGVAERLSLLDSDAARNQREMALAAQTMRMRSSAKQMLRDASSASTSSSETGRVLHSKAAARPSYKQQAQSHSRSQSSKRPPALSTSASLPSLPPRPSSESLSTPALPDLSPTPVTATVTGDVEREAVLAASIAADANATHRPATPITIPAVSAAQFLGSERYAYVYVYIYELSK